MEEKVDWEEEVSLFDLINVLPKRKWVILAVTFIVLALSFLAWRFMLQTYKAEFEVSYAESSLPSEFKGSFTALYDSGQTHALVPYLYSYICQSCEMESPEDFLVQFQNHEALLSIAQELGVKETWERSAFSLRIQRKRLEEDESLLRGLQRLRIEGPWEIKGLWGKDPVSLKVEQKQPKGTFLVTLSARDGELLQRMAKGISGKIEEELLGFLRKQHQRKTEFFQNLQKEVSERYLAAKDKFFAFVKEHNFEESFLGMSPEKTLSLDTSKGLLFLPQSFSLHSGEETVSEKDSGDLEILDEYNLLLRDYTFWREISSLLTLSLPPTLEDGSYPFDGEVKIGEIVYSGTERSLKLNLAVGLVAGLFVGVLVAFFWEFWEKGKEARK